MLWALDSLQADTLFITVITSENFLSGYNDDTHGQNDIFQYVFPYIFMRKLYVNVNYDKKKMSIFTRLSKEEMVSLFSDTVQFHNKVRLGQTRHFMHFI